jgi:hypothetical protein
MVLFVNGKLLVNGAEVPDKVLAAVPSSFPFISMLLFNCAFLIARSFACFLMMITIS